METPDVRHGGLVMLNDTPPYVHLTERVEVVEVDSEGVVVVHGPAPERVISLPDGVITGTISTGGLYIHAAPAFIVAAKNAGIPVVYV